MNATSNSTSGIISSTDLWFAIENEDDDNDNHKYRNADESQHASL
jgi:hypothetical protein